MYGHGYRSLLLGLCVILGVTALPVRSNAQGTTAFPMLSYQPIRSDSPLANPAAFADRAPDGTAQDEEITYQRNPLVGAAIGAVIGAAAGYVAGGDATDRTRAEQALIGAAVGAGMGLVIGYFIKTPVVKETALGTAIPEQLAVIATPDGTVLHVGWTGHW